MPPTTAPATPAPAAAAPAPAPIPIPAIRDTDGKLKHLKAGDFPKTREGRKAFMLYKAEVFGQIASDWRKRAEEIEKADDPKFQKQRRMEKLRDQLKRLEAELAKA